MSHIERMKRSPELLAAICAEGRARFDAALGFACIDGERGEASWVHARQYIRDQRPYGFRVVPIRPLDIERLKVNESGYFVSIIRSARTAQLHSKVLEMIQSPQFDEFHWCTVYLTRDLRRSEVVVGRDGVRRPLAVPDVAERLQPIEVDVAGRRFQCTLPARFKVVSSRPLVRLPLRCDFPRLRLMDYEYVVRSRNDKAIGETAVEIDIEPSGGSHDRLSVKALRRGHVVETSQVSPSAPFPRVVLHVVYDRTTVDPDCFAAAFFETRQEGGGAASSNLQPSDWNHRLRARAATAVSDAVAAVAAASGRRFDIELWTFGDDPRRGLETHRLGGAAFTHPGPCVNGLRQILEQKGECGWCYGLDYVDAVDEALAAVARGVKAYSGEAQHAVLIIGDSPPPPAAVGDGLWNALVDGRQANCRRSPHFNDAIAALRSANVPVGWAFVRMVPHESLEPDLRAAMEQIRKRQGRVIEALRHVEGLDVKICEPETIDTAVRSLVEEIAELDQRYGHPDEITIIRGVFHELV